MRHALSSEMAPGLPLSATQAEVDAWMKTDPEGIKTTIFEPQKFVLIAYDYESTNNHQMSVMGDVTFIGMPLSWIYLRIAWYQKMGYKQIFIQPMSVITPKAAMKRVEVYPGLLSDYTDEEFEAWMKVDPPGTVTKIERDLVTIFYERPGDNSKVTEMDGVTIHGNPWTWIYLRTAYHAKSGKKVIVRPTSDLK